MKFKYAFRDDPCCFRVLLSQELQRVACPDFGAMVRYGTDGDLSRTPSEVTLELAVQGEYLTCAVKRLLRVGRMATSRDFTCRVRLPTAQISGADAWQACVEAFLRHVLSPVCAGALGDTTFVDWDDIEDWLRSCPDLLLGEGVGDSIAAAYLLARVSLQGHLDRRPNAEVFMVALSPPHLRFWEGLREVRAAWGDLVVCYGFPMVESNEALVSLLVSEAEYPTGP